MDMMSEMARRLQARKAKTEGGGGGGGGAPVPPPAVSIKNHSLTYFFLIYSVILWGAL